MLLMMVLMFVLVLVDSRVHWLLHVGTKSLFDGWLKKESNETSFPKLPVGSSDSLSEEGIVRQTVDGLCIDEMDRLGALILWDLFQKYVLHRACRMVGRRTAFDRVFRPNEPTTSSRSCLLTTT